MQCNLKKIVNFGKARGQDVIVGGRSNLVPKREASSQNGRVGISESCFMPELLKPAFIFSAHVKMVKAHWTPRLEVLGVKLINMNFVG